LNFAASAWLWAGLAVAVPIVLHLLGRGRGARRVWPSVRLLRETGLASGARWRPSQPWLLLLRCALLAVVAVALAGPWIEARGRTGTVWLIEPGAGEVGLGGKAARSAAAGGGGNGAGSPRAGEEVRYLAAGLPDSSPRVTSGVPDLWSLLAEADAAFPSGLDFKVVARPRLGALRGNRPALAREVAWYSAEATRTPVAPRQIRVRLLVAAAPARRADAAGLRAGLARGADALGWTLEETAHPAAADLLVGLGVGGQELPAGWAARVERGGTLLREEAGETRACASLVATRWGGGGFARWQCGREPAGRALWRDGAGRAVLARQPSGAGAILSFAGRFAPSAADWTSGAWAALLREVFGDPLPADAETSAAQALPERLLAQDVLSRGAAGRSPNAAAAAASEGAAAEGPSGGPAAAARSGVTAAPGVGISAGAGSREGAAEIAGASTGAAETSGARTGVAEVARREGPASPVAGPLAGLAWLLAGAFFAAERWLVWRGGAAKGTR
jgi:hypothetical protein